MKKLFLTAIVALTAATGYAQTAAKKDVVELAMESPNHTQFVNALKTAELVNTFKGRGPFTIFAPTNDAIAKVPKAAQDKLMSADSKTANMKLLTYHVISKNLSSADIMAAIQAGGGKAEFTTFSADKLTAEIVDGKVKLIDEKGKSAWVIATDMNASNGTIHSIDSVLMPQ